jgi:hypothetical protein
VVVFMIVCGGGRFEARGMFDMVVELNGVNTGG